MNNTSLLALLAEIADTGEVLTNPDLELFATQTLDSMRAIELIVALDERFGISVSPANLDREQWATPAKFVSDVEARIAAK
jgi:D-alanine--poly(phosphoribitol) ligase subunit 2